MSEDSLVLFLFFPRMLRPDHRSVLINVPADIKAKPKA